MAQARSCFFKLASSLGPGGCSTAAPVPAAGRPSATEKTTPMSTRRPLFLILLCGRYLIQSASYVQSLRGSTACAIHHQLPPRTRSLQQHKGAPPPPPGIAPHPIRGLISLLHKGLRKASRGGRSTHMYSASLPIRTRGKRVKGPPRGRRRRRRPASSLRGLLLPLIRPPIHPKHQHHLLIR